MYAYSIDTQCGAELYIETVYGAWTNPSGANPYCHLQVSLPVPNDVETIVVAGRATNRNIYVGPIGKRIELGARQHP